VRQGAARGSECGEVKKRKLLVRKKDAWVAPIRKTRQRRRTARGAKK